MVADYLYFSTKQTMDFPGLEIDEIRVFFIYDLYTLIHYSTVHFTGFIEHNSDGGETSEGQKHLEVPLFELATLLNATNTFSNDNKLGEGGFGPVYKVSV